MNPIWFELMVAVVLVVVAVSLANWYLGYKASRSEWRMFSMMQRVGLDPVDIETGDNEATMKSVRRRCKHCQAEDLCERWLAGEVEGANTFCPNARTFTTMKNREPVAVQV